jgi:nucleotide-binding universal stress UspA family protein
MFVYRAEHIMDRLEIPAILVASDLSAGSDAVLSSTFALAEKVNAEVHVLHALDLATVPYSAMSATEGFQQRRQDARDALEEQVLRVAPEGVGAASQQVKVEAAPKAILDRAGEVDARLIVIGPATPRVFRGPILGNTADHVIRSSAAPVLVIRHPTTFDVRNVVVPIDLGDPARGALDQALLWASNLGGAPPDAARSTAVVQALYVIPRKYQDDEFAFDRVVAAPQLHIEAVDAQARVGGTDAISMREVLIWGDEPVDEIVRYVESQPTDLLVLGTHGYGAIGRALIGSVTSRVVRSAVCPMLLVPPAMWAVE